jgi:hypothetical protein
VHDEETKTAERSIHVECLHCFPGELVLVFRSAVTVFCGGIGLRRFQCYKIYPKHKASFEFTPSAGKAARL